MNTKPALIFVLICVPFTAQAQSTLDDQVKPLINSFKGRVSLFAKNLDTGESR